MNYKSRISIKIAGAFALISLCLTQPVKSQIPGTEIFNAPPPPPDINAPGNRTAGGKRGCENMQKQLAASQEKLLTALVPVYQSPNAELVFGLTTISHPTFWFYIPYKTTDAAEFVLQNQEGQTVYQSPVSLSGTPGVVSLSLPSTAASLKIGDRYHWYFNIYCNPQQPPVFVDGWIKRVEPNTVLKTQLEKATPNQRVALYATHGIWYDLVAASGELRRLDPKDNNWANILQSIGLNYIASEPIVDCCR
ncbi:hypothetical protein A4S05_35540 [Nostoc sp. KVJ20]|uniref:DUF928 domain-containing protein n=1 Tax=Nostoc sp. KVJ20 TaxID=457944 RepID=UPI00083DB55F|nr:DUF928 domain-containing protein [Nostoc sp. KVJ20]ODG99952.1 hypothetical protein A4S05_35540 [Nostoc sp. KVJ20]